MVSSAVMSSLFEVGVRSLYPKSKFVGSEVCSTFSEFSSMWGANLRCRRKEDLVKLKGP